MLGVAIIFVLMLCVVNSFLSMSWLSHAARRHERATKIDQHVPILEDRDALEFLCFPLAAPVALLFDDAQRLNRPVLGARESNS